MVIPGYDNSPARPMQSENSIQEIAIHAKSLPNENQSRTLDMEGEALIVDSVIYQ